MKKSRKKLKERKEERKNMVRSNPWQLGHLDNEINFEPLISFLS